MIVTLTSPKTFNMLSKSIYLIPSLLAILQHVASEALPYNPTRVFVADQKEIAYVFQPSSAAPGQSQLLSVDITSTLNTTSLLHSTLYESLPFLQDDALLAYTPVIDSYGTLTVSSGNCSQGGEGSQIWRFTPNGDSAVGNGTWSQFAVQEQGLGSQDGQAGSNYLSNGVAFSSLLNGSSADTGLYIFGGMCPFANATASTWTSAAEYSDLMLAITPQESTADKLDYDISIASSRGPPIAEAGFSITALPPSYSVNSSNVAQSQQQDFVLLGGHTETAFINMSQVALFSLPQESWTFLPVTQPSSAQTELAARQSQQEIQPRSGHTAVLSEDGTSIVLFGGWVGDVNTPASPQLAILNLGDGYGGESDWTWTVPSPTGTGLASGAGIYGHGAALLSGGVMMVVGGYSIPASPSKRGKRDVQPGNSNTYFFNTTSNAWISSYTPPSAVSAQSGKHSSGALSTTSKKAGLGVGLALLFLLLVGLVVFYFWYTRRLKRTREERARELQHSSDGSVEHSDHPFLEKGGVDGRGGEMSALGHWEDREHYAQPWAPATNPGWRSNQAKAREAERTGLFVNIPSPTRGLRKGQAARNYQYHAAPRYDENRVSHGSGNIHPIAEVDAEEERSALGEEDQPDMTEAEIQLQAVERILNAKANLDPFRDPEPNPLGSHPVSPVPGDTVRRVPTGASRASPPPRLPPIDSVHDSQANWLAEPTSSDSTGRTSPSRSDDRTSSTLSERSQRSILTAGSIARTLSTRTGALLAAAMAAGEASNDQDPSPTDNKSFAASTYGGRKSPFFYQSRARSLTSDSVRPGAVSRATDADSFTTARTNFAHLQSEGEALLGGRPPIDYDDPYQRALAAHTQPQRDTSSDYLDHGLPPPIPPRRRLGWMGSLRRAIGGVYTGERSASMTHTSRYTDDQRSSSSSPTKAHRRDNTIGSTPRRAASDGGALLRQKRGKRDWDPETDGAWPAYRDDPAVGDWGEPRSSMEKRQLEEEWDVEDAAAQRDVQVMFTVPKARLRVVNADVERASLRSASEGTLELGREGSLKALGQKGSRRDLRVQSEGERTVINGALVEEEEEGEGQGEKEKEKEA